VLVNNHQRHLCADEDDACQNRLVTARQRMTIRPTPFIVTTRSAY
jgi:hypothetical protein